MNETVKRAGLMLECPQLCTPAPIVVSVNGRTLFWTLPLATTRIVLIRSDVVDVTAVELAALHYELAVDPLRWFADFAMAFIGCRLPALSGADPNLVHQQTYDQLNFGGVATVEELARQILICVDASSDPGNVSGSDSRFYIGSQRAGDALVLSLRRHVARQTKDLKETEPAQRRSR